MYGTARPGGAYIAHMYINKYECCRWTGAFTDATIEGDYHCKSHANILTQARIYLALSRALLIAMCASVHALGVNEGWAISIWEVGNRDIEMFVYMREDYRSRGSAFKTTVVVALPVRLP